MKKTISIEEKRLDLERQIKRLEAFEKIEDLITLELRGYMTMRVLEKSHRNEDGTYTNTVYAYDEEGNLIYDEPTEDSYWYDAYVALASALEEVRQLV